jgi:hypothetical protein
MVFSPSDANFALAVIFGDNEELQVARKISAPSAGSEGRPYKPWAKNRWRDFQLTAVKGLGE